MREINEYLKYIHLSLLYADEAPTPTVSVTNCLRHPSHCLGAFVLINPDLLFPIINKLRDRNIEAIVLPVAMLDKTHVFSCKKYI